MDAKDERQCQAPQMKVRNAFPPCFNAARRLMALNDAPYRHDRQVIQEWGSRSEHIQIINTGGYQGLCG